MKPLNEKRIKAQRIFSNNIFLFSYIWKYAPAFLVQEIFNAILSGVISSMFPIYTKLFYDAVSGQKELRYILIVSGIIMVIDILVNLLYFSYYRTIWRESLLIKLKYAMNSELFEVTRKLDLSCYDNAEFYNNFVWSMNQSDMRVVNMVDSLVKLIRNSVRIVTIYSILTSISWHLAMIAMTVAVTSIVLCKSILHIAVRRNVALNPLQRRAAYYERVFSRPDTAKEVRVTHVSELILQKYDKTIEDIECITRRAGYRAIPFTMLNEILAKVTEPLVYMLLLFQVMVLKTAELGGLAVAVSAFWGLRYSLEDILNTMLEFEEHALYTEKLRELLEHKNTLRSGNLPYEPLNTITFRNVCFGYSPEKEVLHQISMTIHRGEKIALVGYNGAGKTTFIKLLLHLYDPTAGEILVNGKNIGDFDADSYRQSIGAVFQDFQLYALSIAENVICDVVTPADDGIAWESLKRANFIDKLQELSDGLRTELTKEFYDGGTNLSGGESQKVAISRTFARPFDLIIMDEPSSALDPISEYQLNQQINYYLRDKTVIYISHRLSTTRNADCIYMFEEGRIIEQGSHDVLMAQNGKYAEMFRVQAKKYGG